jgi:hypothetical protein
MTMLCEHSISRQGPRRPFIDLKQEVTDMTVDAYTIAAMTHDSAVVR